MQLDLQRKMQNNLQPQNFLKKYKSLPVYSIISNTGPRHKPNFKVSVKIKNSKYIVSNGTSKKNAEQSAAKKLLKHLNL